MSIENFISAYINRTSIPGKDSIDSLKAFTEKYSYSESFHLLYLMALKQNQPFEFEDQLQRYAFRINNRERLFELVMQKAEEAEVKNATIVQHREIEDELLLCHSESDSNEKQVEQNRISETLERIEKESEKSSDPLSQEILHHAISSAYELPDLNQEEILEIEKRKASDPVDVTNALPEPFASSENQPLTFSSWLHANQNYTWTNPVEKEYEEKDKEPKLFGNVERPKTDFFSPAKKAKDSLSESALPVSETLAKIYVLQGNYPKAISAYEQLILKIPEKKTFFANLIKDLKKQLNS